MTGGRGVVALTFDIEEWFQVENLRPVVDRSCWESCESRVIPATHRILTTLSSAGVRSTFFFLGWVAKKHPRLVQEVAKLGHEVASHGFYHEIAYRQSDQEFLRDVRETKNLLEDIAGMEVLGYRAPNFSITDNHMRLLAQAGYIYDSSFNGFAYHDRYGRLSGLPRGDRGVWAHPSGLLECPVFVLRLGRLGVPWGGGAYFRLSPRQLFTAGLDLAIRRRDDDPRAHLITLYFHPWEFDPDQPRLRGVSAFLRFRHYFGLKTSAAKLEQLVRRFGSVPLREAISKYALGKVG